jgi:IS605 OrfB family transposase
MELAARTIKIALTNLSKQDREHLTLLCIHAARIYNAALWCCRQHYINPSIIPDCPDCLVCPCKEQFETLRYSLSKNKIAQLAVPEEIRAKLRPITKRKVFRSEFEEHLKECLSRSEMTVYGEKIFESCQYYDRFLTTYTLDSKVLRHRESTRVHFEISSKTAHYMVDQAVKDIRNYDKSIWKYLQKHHLSFLQLRAEQKKKKYRDAPRIPGYKKDQHYLGENHRSDQAPPFGRIIAEIGNGFVKVDDRTLRLSLSKTLKDKGFTPICIPIPEWLQFNDIRKLQITPKFRSEEFSVSLTYQASVPTTTTPDSIRIMGIDLGVNNLAACVDMETPFAFLFKGSSVKSINWFWNKECARLRECMADQDPRSKYSVTEESIQLLQTVLPDDLLLRYKQLCGQSFATAQKLILACHLTGDEQKQWQQLVVPFSTQSHKFPQSRQLYRITRRRNAKIEYIMQQVARYIVDYCVKHHINTVVVGVNVGWKQGVNIGKRNTQNFVQIPFLQLRNYLKYACEPEGIAYIEHEESFTSLCSFLDYMEIPTYDGSNELHTFSKSLKKRRKRGLYQTNNGTHVNADCNGAANIAVKSGNWQGDRSQFLACLRSPKIIKLSEIS